MSGELLSSSRSVLGSCAQRWHLPCKSWFRSSSTGLCCLAFAMKPLNAMRGATSHLLLCLISVIAVSTYGSPVVVNTWPFVDATSEAWRSLLESADPNFAALNAVEQVRWSLCQRWIAKLRQLNLHHMHLRALCVCRAAASARMTSVILQLAMAAPLMKMGRPHLMP